MHSEIGYMKWNFEFVPFINYIWNERVLEIFRFARDHINPVKDGLFPGCSRMGGAAKKAPSLKSVTHILQ